MKHIPETAIKIDLSLVYIYGLADPINKHIKYVGQSKNPIARYKSHKKGLKHWFEQLKAGKETPDLYILEVVSTKNSAKRERYWIQWFGLKNLFNQQDGTGFDLRNRTKEKERVFGVKNISDKKLRPNWLMDN